MVTVLTPWTRLIITRIRLPSKNSCKIPFTIRFPGTLASNFTSPTIFTLSLVRQFAPFLVRLGPPWFRRRLVEWIPNNAVQKLKGMSDVMHEKAKEILELKRQELKYDPHSGDEIQEGRLKDIISALGECALVRRIALTQSYH